MLKDFKEQWCITLRIFEATFFFCQAEFDENELLAFAGLKNDNRPDAADIKKEMDKKRSNFIDVLQVHIKSTTGNYLVPNLTIFHVSETRPCSLLSRSL